MPSNSRQYVQGYLRHWSLVALVQQPHPAHTARVGVSSGEEAIRTAAIKQWDFAQRQGLRGFLVVQAGGKAAWR